MKRIFSFLLLFLLLPVFWGCEKEDSAKYVNFYYVRVDFGYDSEMNSFSDSAFSAEKRDTKGHQSTTYLLSEYLKGPTEENLINPFPEGTGVLASQITGNTILLTVTDDLADLTGLNLVIACTALGRTAMELTKTDSVQISCETALLDGKSTFTIDSTNIIYTDTIPTETSAD